MREIFEFLKKHCCKLFFGLVLFFAWGWYWFFLVSPYYFSIPVRVDDGWGLPLVQMEIKEKNYEVELDFGTRLSSLFSKDLEAIEKEVYGTFCGFDIHGKAYASPIYQVSGIKISDLSVPIMKIREESTEFLANSVLNGNVKELPYSGRLGREIFEDKNFLFDFARSRIIVCKNFKDLAKENYRLESFTKVPFEVTAMGICFLIKTDTGEKNLVLDTGSSITLIRGSFMEEKSTEGCLQTLPVWHTKKFILGNCDFGERNLHLFKISSLLNGVDGLLGMDFLKEHAVYIDMGRHIAYIGKSSTVF